MQITILAAGSRGDIQPCVVLGSGLRRAGADVLVAAPENFAGFIRQHGLRVRPLRGDVQAIMAGETGRGFMEAGGANPLRSIRAMRALLGPVAMGMAEDALDACGETDALISLAVLAPFAGAIAEARRIRLLHVEPTPVLPTRAFPAPGWPVQRSLGGPLNRLSGVAMLRVLWLWYRPFADEFRRRLGLPRLSAADHQRLLASTPLLGAYSPHVVPPPADWPATAHVTGYWLPETAEGFQPAPDLAAFLEAGDPPVYVGFGSMAGRHPERLAATVLEALAMSGRRGLILTGWGGLRARSLPENVFALDSAPHDWLFPRMAAVVHHGGAGTTAEGLRAGVPSVVVPFIMDQPFWGHRVHALGVGPAPISRNRLTAERLARVIRAAVERSDIRPRAAALGEAIRAEDGVGRAVGLVMRYLGDQS